MQNTFKQFLTEIEGKTYPHPATGYFNHYGKHLDNKYRQNLLRDAAYEKEHDELANHYKNSLHSSAIYQYSGGSRELNEYLWTKHKHPTYEDEEHEYAKHVKDIDAALNEHKTPHTMKLYSGSIHDPRHMKDENNIVHHPAYLSSSINPYKGFFFTSMSKKFNPITEKYNLHIYHLNVPKGHPGAYIGHRSEFQSEREFLLPRDTKMKYSHTDTHEYSDANVHEHHLDVLPNK